MRRPITRELLVIIQEPSNRLPSVLLFHAKQDQSYSNPAMAELGLGRLIFAISMK